MKITTLPRVLACALTMGLSAGSTLAGSTHPMATDTSCNISVESWLEHVPPTGWMPMTIKITNNAPENRTWTLSTTDSDFMSGETRGILTVGAPANGATSTLVLVPVSADLGSSRSYSNVRCMLNGPGLKTTGAFFLSAATPGGSRSSSKTPTPFLGVSKEFENSYGAVWRSAGFSTSREFVGDTVNMDDAPADWRGFSGLAQLWITDSEWKSLKAAQLQALLTWVSHGGQVVVTGAQGVTALPLPEGFAPWKNSILRHGLGRVQLLSAKEGVAKETPGLLADIQRVSFEKLAGDQPPSGDRLTALLPPLQMHSALIFGFILIFGLVVGPVNLFWLASGSRRPRMFWTTPLISLIGTAVLIVVMVVQDGFGGTGARVLLAVILPGQKEMAVTQEQVARTGILIGHDCELPRDAATMITRLPIDPSTSSSTGFRIRQEDKRGVTISNGHLTGDWFTSRSFQSHLLQTTRLTRGTVEFTSGDSPSIVNSLPTALKKVYVRDAQGQLWETAGEVHTGERVTLKHAIEKPFKDWLEKNARSNLGHLMRHHVDQATTEAQGAWFFAEATEPAKLATPTLDSIRWEQDRAFVTGPLNP